MKNSIKKNLRFSFLSLLAVFLFFSVVSCNSVKQVPVYEGMTISTKGNVATRKLNKHNEEEVINKLCKAMLEVINENNYVFEESFDSSIYEILKI